MEIISCRFWDSEEPEWNQSVSGGYIIQSLCSEQIHTGSCYQQHGFKSSLCGGVLGVRRLLHKLLSDLNNGI